jgi:O-antigen biosynthesis protein
MTKPTIVLNGSMARGKSQSRPAFHTIRLPGNTSPKHTTDQRWHPYPAIEIRTLLGADGEFYQGGIHDPLMVSCIMPTYNRRRFVPQAIQYFLRQDYPHRELIVVDDGSDPIGDLIPRGAAIRYMYLPRKQSIGAKRNLACDVARGVIIVCWDDDDWYAPNRLTYQTAALLDGKADATGLDRGLLLSLPSRQFWTYSAHLHNRMFAQGIVGGTLAFWKRLWDQGTRFPDASLAEDAAFLRALMRRGARIARLENAGTFIYVRHDQNSWRFTPGHFLDGGG